MRGETSTTTPRARRFGGVSLLWSVILHGALVAGAGFYVVQETTLEKKKTFEARRIEEAPARREIEHRVQVARRSGAAASVSPVSAQRIQSTAASALALPALPELPVMGAGMFGSGFNQSGAGIGMGSGAGSATGLGAAGLGGRGFMSTSFLGMTDVRVRKVVFVLDVSRDLMDIRKGGFKAFSILREEIVRLVSQLPPAAEFGVVLFGGSAGDINLFKASLAPAIVANKEALFGWIKPLNASPERLGTHSAGAFLEWKERPLSESGLDSSLMPPPWLRALHAALEMKPETVILVTGSGSTPLRRRTEERMDALNRRNDAWKDKLRRSGIDPEGVAPARAAALAQARKQLNEINEKLKAQGKSPFIVTDTKRIFLPDFQAELKRHGFSIELDMQGWTDAQGKPIWEMGVSGHERVAFTEALSLVARLQNALLREKAVINAFLFVGPDERPKEAVENLTALCKRNGGKFELLSAKRLDELKKDSPRGRGVRGED